LTESFGSHPSSLPSARPARWHGRRGPGREGTSGARAAGFTLLEILVVLVVVGVSLALVSVNFLPDDRRLLRDSGERIAAILEQAQDEALMTGGSIAWSATDYSYRFWKLDPDHNWVDASADEWLQERLFEPGVRVSELRIDDKPAKADARIVLSASGRGVPFRLVLALRAERLGISGDALGRITLDAGAGS
jgi:general secretion pathway protein H